MKHVYGVLCLDSDGRFIYHTPQASLRDAESFVSVLSKAEPIRSFFVTVSQKGAFVK